jgi:hypothetical protein
MSAKRFVLSLFFTWHIVAIGLGSLASPGAVGTVGPPRHPQNDALAAFVTPRLDTFAAAVAPLAKAYDHTPLIVRQLSANYLELVGVSQSWKMFSNPPMVHQYLRVRYYVGSAGANDHARPSWTATELVLPAHREDQVRIVRGYWDAFRDKAMTSALARFHAARPTTLIRPDTKSAELPDHLAPIVRYFRRRFEETALRPDERVLRAEIWYGTAPMPPAGDRDEPGRLETRYSALQGYFEGPVENHFGRPEFPPYHAGQREADINWVLEYFEP